MKPGERIGAYTVERRLGRGAMGAVYLVTQAATRRRCALKVLNADDMDGKDEAVTRFKHEVQSLIRLRGHPSIVGILDSGITPESDPYFVMEFVEGVTFRQALRGGAPLAELLESLEQVARALAYAHQLGFVHRDVKPENVLLGADGVSRLTDFGIAAGLYRTNNLTQTGSILGTLAYMAPEQANTQLGRVGPWSDAYSLGAMLYEVLTGQLPLGGANTMELLTKLLLQSGEIRPPRQLVPGVDPRLEAICLKALTWAPAGRFTSLQEMADALAQVRPPIEGTRWARRYALATAGTSVADEDGLTAMATELAQAAAVAPAVTERTAVDTTRREQSGRLKPVLEVTVADEDAAIPLADEPAGQGSRALPIVVGLTILSLGLVGLSAAILHLRRRATPAPLEVGPGALDTGPLRALIMDGKWDEALGEGERLAADHGQDPELVRLLTQAHQGRIQGAFRAEDTARARELLPADWSTPFPDLPWILALTGDPRRALTVLPDDTPIEHRARLTAWAGDEAGCRAALEKLPLDQGRALSWELGAFIPALRPTPTAKGLLPSEERSEGWAAVARGEEALARGVIAVAAIAFDDALQRGSPEAGVRLQATLGMARVELARGRLTSATEQLAEAFRWVRHQLDMARCLGWSAQVTVALGGTPALLELPTGGDVLARARRFAPGAPEVQQALWNQQLCAWANERPRALEGACASSAWAAVEQARAARRGAAPAPAGGDAGEGSFCAAEWGACERGEDGACGLLVARAVRLATTSEQNGWRPGGQEAQKLLDTALKLRPGSPAAWLAQARAALLLRQHERALEAVERAGLLSPRDPQVLTVRARVLRSGLERAALEIDQAALRSAPPEAKAREQARALEPVAAAFRAAREAAPEGHALARGARVGEAWTQLERMRRLEQAGDAAGAGAARTELLAELGPLWQGPAGDPAPALIAARARLAEALRGGEPRPIEEAEQALRAAAAPLDLAAKQALLIAGLAGEADRAQAWLAVAGDLPGRALLALRRAEAASEAGERERWLERGLALAPELPQLGTSREVQRGAGSSAESFLQLARALPRSTHLLSLWVGILYWAERPPQDELLGALDAAGDSGAAWVAPLARALALRTYPIFRFPDGEPSAARLRELGLEHDKLSTRAVVEATLSLQSSAPALQEGALAGPGALAHLLRAMCQSSLGLGSPRGSRCDPRVLGDVRFDISCARAAAPLDPSLALFWLHWSQERLPETVDELLAWGFMANRDALLRHLQRDKVDELLRELNDLFPKDTSVEEVRRGVLRLQKGERAPLLALALATLAADRLEAGGVDEDPPPPGGAALGVLPEETWHAQARAALAQARAGRPELLGQAAECALRALSEASPCGEALLPDESSLLAMGALPRLPADFPHRAELVPANIPLLPTLGDVTLRLRRSEDALDALTRATAGAQGGAEPPLAPDASPWTPSRVGWPRGLALLLAPQESLAQDRLVAWLAAGERWDEALLTGLRAGAFSRVEAPAVVLHRVARERLRAPALASEGAARGAGLRAALTLAREAREVSRFPAGHGALIALLETDLAALGPPEEAGARLAWARSQAEQALAAEREREVDPWLGAWALARACVAAREPVPADALTRLGQPGVRELLAPELRHDPLAERLRADAALGPLLPPP